MRINVDPQAARGLSLISEIPNHRECLVEGRNGVGKTLTVRLLQLIAGVQPFDDPAQWSSLQSRLGNTIVTVSEMADGGTLRFTFTPSRWPDIDTDTPVLPDTFGDWLGEAQVNGTPVSVDEARGLLSVVRFAGNEDLEATLRKRLKLYEDQAAATSQVVHNAVGLVQEIVDPLLDRLTDVDPERLIADRRSLVRAEKSEAEIGQALEALIERHAELLNALDARDRLADAGAKADEWSRRSTEIAARLSAIAKERPVLEKEIDEATVAQRRLGDVAQTLSEARRQQRQRLTRKRNREQEVGELTRVLGVEANARAIASLEHDVRASIRAMERQRTALDAAGSTVRLIDRLGAVLSSETAMGLDEQPLVVTDDTQLTVADVRGGLVRRNEQLRSEPRPDELQALLRRLQQERIRLSRTTELAQRLRDVKRAGELLEEAEADVHDAEARMAAAGGEDEQVKALTAQLVELEEEANHLALEQADLNAGMSLEGGRSAEDAQDDLKRTLDELKLVADELADAEITVRQQIRDLTQQRDEQTERASALRRSVTLHTAILEDAISAITTDPRLRGLAAIAPLTDLLDKARSDPALIAGLKFQLNQTDQRLRDAESLIDQLTEVAASAMAESSGRVPELTEPIRAVLNEELREALDQPSIQELVFDGARVSRVDVVNRRLSLIDDDGSEDQRGFATFSTGEQAFAFTQARILELPHSPRPNRLLVLDEFGAFVAADRMPALARFLADDKVRRIVDQVLVILPLHANYADELNETTGDLHERYAERIRQIDARGYFTVPLNS